MKTPSPTVLSPSSSSSALFTVGKRRAKNPPGKKADQNRSQKRGGSVLAKSADQQLARREEALAHQALHRFLLELVGLVFHVQRQQLLSASRGRRKTALARQVAMYLAHTSGGLNLSAVGRLFARDRTTVAHACALVEDARDEAVFDQTLTQLESAIACQMELFRHSCRLQDHHQADELSLEEGQSL